jgi:DNA repair exonuclease SbcCD ATPase subunit
MKHKILKVLACISLVAMVLSAVTPGAFANESGTVDEAKKLGGHLMGHSPHGEPEMDCEGMEAPVFDTEEEEEMEFLVEMHTEQINNRIDMLTEMLDDLGENSGEHEAITEEIEELEALLEDIEDATTLDELKEILEEAKESMMPEMKGEKPEKEEMEFESDEDEMEYLVERETEHISKRIGMLEEELPNTDDEDKEAEIEDQITELEELLENIESATTLDELKEVLGAARESMMENMPEKGERPEMEKMEFDSDEEEIEFLVERQTESINKRLEMLQEMLDKVDEIDDENITEDSIENQITELEELLENIESAETLDELKEILEEYRINNPRPEGHGRGHGPMGPVPELEEEVTGE